MFSVLPRSWSRRNVRRPWRLCASSTSAACRRSALCRPYSFAINKPLKCGQDSFNSLLVLDFEATCDNGRQSAIKPQEVIEFPVLRLDRASGWRITSTFHRYVKPDIHPELTPFCTNLTGIIQEMVEAEASLETVLDDFHRWLDEEKLVPSATGADARFAFVTCGDWDLKTLLPTQLDHLGVPVPPYFRSWINMKVIFAEATSIYPRNLPYMLHHLKLPLIGRLHSGIDDCRNMAAVIRALDEKYPSKCCWHLTSAA